MDKEASRLEKDYVHRVYEKIAPHFNDTRYKAWPRVRQFLLEQESGSLIADIGCGNGKYLCINNQAYKVGCDYCLPLVESAREQSYEAMVCDNLHLPYRNQCFDAILSIAVIHHFSTKERRIQAIKEMARILRVRGKMMIYVWAMEQKRRKFEKQDIFIPWNPTPLPAQSSETTIMNEDDKSFLHNNIIHKDKPFLCNNEQNVHEKHTKTNWTSILAREDTLLVEKCFKLWLFSRLLNSVLKFSSNNRTKTPNKLWLYRDYSTTFKTSSVIKSFEQSHSDHMTNIVSNGFSYGQSCETVLDVLSESQPPSHHNGSESHMQFFEYPYPGSFGIQDSTGLFCSCTEFSLPDLASQPLFQNKLHSHPKKNKPAICSSYEKIRHSMGPQTQSSLITDSTSWPLEPQVLSKDKKDQINVNSACLRYYHVFKQGELIELIEKYTEDLKVIKTYYDHANWCVIVEKV
ncbi:probable tRNA methyltransferase 9B [Pristis pectinata]|uniref:probable tRNA methyltransferase 9B n=1 Tax=Pristis pectinata TaxID=685728 RepID=UPI00223D2A8F|nr:probable tRNA methyltransferase 9B [Pristis pectinata]